MRTISFISANFVARAAGYSGQFGHDWGKYDQATIQAASPEHFTAAAREVADAGFEAIDIWSAHCHYQHHAQGDYLEQVKGICSQFDLAITSYAGGLGGKTAAELESQFRFIKQLGAPMFGGGIPNARQMAPIVNDICQKLDLKWAYENHPEKTYQEILGKIDDGKHERVGVALDTGWCGTQGMDAVEAARRLRDKLILVHLKDVEAVGAHDTCALGEGIAPVEKVVRYLIDSDWQGNIAIEHEPYDRDPMPEIKTSLKRLREWLE